MGLRITILAARVVLWGVLVPLAVPVVLVGMFVVAARWLIYFLAGIVLMAYALGSKQYMNYFWLAFALPFFVGGLIDGVALLIAERLPERAPARG